MLLKKKPSSQTCFLSYHCKSSILKFLKFEKRRHLSRSCPSIRSLERRLPYYFHHFSINPPEDLMNHEAWRLEIDYLLLDFHQTPEGIIVEKGTFSRKFRLKHRILTSLTPRNFHFHVLGHFLNRPGTTIHSLDLLRCSWVLQRLFPLRVWYLGLVLHEYHPEHFDSLMRPVKIKIRVLIDKEAIDVLADKKSILEVSRDVYIQKFPKDAPKQQLLDFHRRKFAWICKAFMKTPGPNQHTVYHLDKYSYVHRSALFQLISNQLGGGSYHNHNIHFYRGKHVYWVYGMNRKEVFWLVIHRLDYNDNNCLIVESSWKDRMRIRVRNGLRRIGRMCKRGSQSEEEGREDVWFQNYLEVDDNNF